MKLISSTNFILEQASLLALGKISKILFTNRTIRYAQLLSRDIKPAFFIGQAKHQLFIGFKDVTHVESRSICTHGLTHVMWHTDTLGWNPAFGINKLDDLTKFGFELTPNATKLFL